MMRNTLESIWGPQAQQQVYRDLLTVMSRPGTVEDLAAVLEGRDAAIGVLAALTDGEVSLADTDGLISALDWPLLEAREDVVSVADYIIADGSLSPLDSFEPYLGTLSNPEGGATILLVVEAIGAGGQVLELSGPGVDGTNRLPVEGLEPRWLSRREGWVASFPMGVDVILCTSTRIAAIPRSIRVDLRGK